MLTTYAVRPGGHPRVEPRAPRDEAPLGFHDCRGTWHGWDELAPAPAGPVDRPC